MSGVVGPACTMHHVMLGAKTLGGARPLSLCSVCSGPGAFSTYKEFQCACLCRRVAVHASLSDGEFWQPSQRMQTHPHAQGVVITLAVSD